MADPSSPIPFDDVPLEVTPRDACHQRPSGGKGRCHLGTQGGPPTDAPPPDRAGMPHRP
jgi:hypothetical protein